jgi:hypothetical protein
MERSASGIGTTAPLKIRGDSTYSFYIEAEVYPNRPKNRQAGENGKTLPYRAEVVAKGTVTPVPRAL